MVDKPCIMIVEDDPIIAMGLELAVLDHGGVVSGPFDAVEMALAALAARVPQGAILDANLLDGSVSPLARRLIHAGTPFLIHSARRIPDDLAEEYPGLPFMAKPAPPLLVAARLFELYG